MFNIRIIFLVVPHRLPAVSQRLRRFQRHPVARARWRCTLECARHRARVPDRQTKPTEVAFGMATRANLQAAVDRLPARGVTEIVAVPLFVSSWSSVITSTEYPFGLRSEAPAASRDLPADAPPSATPPHQRRMQRRHITGARRARDAISPIQSPVPIRMTPALNDHPIVAEIFTCARPIDQPQSGGGIRGHRRSWPDR